MLGCRARAGAPTGVPGGAGPDGHPRLCCAGGWGNPQLRNDFPPCGIRPNYFVHLAQEARTWRAPSRGLRASCPRVCSRPVPCAGDRWTTPDTAHKAPVRAKPNPRDHEKSHPKVAFADRSAAISRSSWPRSPSWPVCRGRSRRTSGAGCGSRCSTRVPTRPR